jgi:hypothetical protein
VRKTRERERPGKKVERKEKRKVRDREGKGRK